jgi:hypothetical protein
MTHCATSDPLCELFSTHVGNAVKEPTGIREGDLELWIVRKDRDGSPDKIDSVPAAVLSWEARNDAIAKGALSLEPELEPLLEFA